MLQSPRSIILPFVALALTGCGGAPQEFDAKLESDRPSARDQGSTGSKSSADVAIVEGRMVSQAAMWDALAEFAGGIILEELVLDRRLENELSRRAIQITDADIRAEEDSLLFLVLGRSTTEPGEAERIIDATRTARGLGQVRYQALLRRNAMLRRLVRDEVEIEEADLERLYQVRYGPRVRARIVVTPTEREAADLRKRIVASDNPRVECALVAMDHSIDATSARGGLIEAFSTEDPAYPASARQALNRITPGELTPVIGLEAGFAFLYLEEIIEPAGRPLEEVRMPLMRELRLRQERILMQQLALELVDTTRVTPVDDGVGWSWHTRIEARQSP